MGFEGKLLLSENAKRNSITEYGERYKTQTPGT